jgi:hypothetical protein
MKKIHLKNRLKYLPVKGIWRILYTATKPGSNAESFHLFFSIYIRAAGGCSLLGNQGLSLFLASGFFTPLHNISPLQNSDK